MFTVSTCFWFLFYSILFLVFFKYLSLGVKIQVNLDGSTSLEGHIFILNSIHSYLIHKTSKQNQLNTPESFDLRSGNLTVKVMSGRLIEQNVEGIM